MRYSYPAPIEKITFRPARTGKVHGLDLGWPLQALRNPRKIVDAVTGNREVGMSPYTRNPFVVFLSRFDQ